MTTLTPFSPAPPQTPTVAPAALGARDWQHGVAAGWGGHCPRCGARTLFERYLKMAGRCGQCGQAFEPYRADDAPAYFTIFVVGHIVVPLVLLVERWAAEPPLWLHAALWIPLSIGLSLGLLPRIKGAVIGALWAVRRDPGDL